MTNMKLHFEEKTKPNCIERPLGKIKSVEPTTFPPFPPCSNEIFKNTYFEEHVRMTAPQYQLLIIKTISLRFLTWRLFNFLLLLRNLPNSMTGTCVFVSVSNNNNKKS